jgi:hypothetical protein
VLFRPGHSSLVLTRDHVATVYEERQRIQKCGGRVVDGRVQGILEVCVTMLLLLLLLSLLLLLLLSLLMLLLLTMLLLTMLMMMMCDVCLIDSGVLTAALLPVVGKPLVWRLALQGVWCHGRARRALREPC